MKSFVEKFTPYYEILIFEEQLCMIRIFIFDTNQAKLTVRFPRNVKALRFFKINQSALKIFSVPMIALLENTD
jgi:hypothetical protein